MTLPIRTTLLDVVQAVSECAASDEEVVATVAFLVNSGKVLLCGTFAGARIDLSVPPGEEEIFGSLTKRTRGILYGPADLSARVRKRFPAFK